LSLVLRYREVKSIWARDLSLASDILNTSFVSLTVVGVLTFSIDLAIHLPDLARTKDIPEKVDLEPVVNKQEDIISELNNLGNLMNNTYSLQHNGLYEIKKLIQMDIQEDFYSKIQVLQKYGNLDKDKLKYAISEVLGNPERYDEFSFNFSIQDQVKWNCTYHNNDFDCDQKY